MHYWFVKHGTNTSLLENHASGIDELFIKELLEVISDYKNLKNFTGIERSPSTNI